MALTCDAYMWCERTRPLHLAVQIHAVRGHVGHPHPSARFVRAGGEAIHRHARQSAGRFAGGVNESFAFFYNSRRVVRAGLVHLFRGGAKERGARGESIVFSWVLDILGRDFFFFFPTVVVESELSSKFSHIVLIIVLSFVPRAFSFVLVFLFIVGARHIPLLSLSHSF